MPNQRKLPNYRIINQVGLMYRILVLHSVAFMALALVVAVSGCGQQSASAPSGSDIENYEKNNPGVLVPASEEDDDSSE